MVSMFVSVVYLFSISACLVPSSWLISNLCQGQNFKDPCDSASTTRLLIPSVPSPISVECLLPVLSLSHKTSSRLWSWLLF